MTAHKYRTYILVVLGALLLSQTPAADAKWYDWMNDKIQTLGNTFHDLIASCPVREGYKESLRSEIEKQIFGQEQAINRVVTAFQTHPANKPLSFHFVGVSPVYYRHTRAFNLAYPEELFNYFPSAQAQPSVYIVLAVSA
jgi:hypothetical protein